MPLSKNKEKYIRSLSAKKNRTLHQNFILEGEKLVIDVLTNNRVEVEAIFALPDWISQHQVLLEGKSRWIEPISPRELKAISSLTTPNQVLMIAKQLEQQIDPQIVKTDWSLYLDRIQDPGNMGTILRIANWFGIRHIFCDPATVELYNPKVIQASMGAFQHVVVLPMVFEVFQQQFPNVPTYSTVFDGQSIFQPLPSSNGLVIFGNEGNGIHESLCTKVDYALSIPAHSSNAMESLNVAVATGIVCSVLRHPHLAV